MTDLAPAPSARTRVRVPFVDPAATLDEDATGSVDLGPDWSALRAFAGIAVALVVAVVVGHRVAGPVGVVVTAGLVALVLFLAAHVRAWALSRRIYRRLDRPAAAAVDTYEGVAEVPGARCSRRNGCPGGVCASGAGLPFAAQAVAVGAARRRPWPLEGSTGRGSELVAGATAGVSTIT